MQRRSFLTALLAAGGGLQVSAQAAASRAPKDLKITGVEVLVTNPDQAPMTNYVLVKLVTNQPGLYGWGDATCTGSDLAVAQMLEEHLKPGLLGRNPMELESLWQTVFFLPYYRSGSVHMSAVSGIDMALWDIKGKVAGLPVYDLLGGRVRNELLTYRSVGGRSFQEVEDGVRKLMERGYRVIKVQVAPPGAEAGYAVPSSSRVEQATRQAYQQGLPPAQVWEPEPYVRTLPKLLEHLRKTVGDEIGLLHDVHERVTPSQAIVLAKAVEDYNLFFFEDPLRPENLDAFRIIRKQCSTPIAMGEIFVGQWDGLFLITEHLIDYVRHDLAHVGGVTTGKKIATMCEPYGILTAWHGPGNISPITHMANCHVSLSVMNFGIQEYSVDWKEGIDEVFSYKPLYANGAVTIHDAPGLGIDVNETVARKRPYLRRLRPTIRRQDGTPWPY